MPQQKATFQAKRQREAHLGNNISSVRACLDDAKHSLIESMMFADDHQLTELDAIHTSIASHMETLAIKFKDALNTYVNVEDELKSIPPALRRGQ